MDSSGNGSSNATVKITTAQNRQERSPDNINYPDRNGINTTVGHTTNLDTGDIGEDDEMSSSPQGSHGSKRKAPSDGYPELVKRVPNGTLYQPMEIDDNQTRHANSAVQFRTVLEVEERQSVSIPTPGMQVSFPIRIGILPAEVKKIRELLSDYYKPYLRIQRVSGKTLDLKSCFINLAVVEAHHQRSRDKLELAKNAATFHRLHSYEQISRTKTNESIPLEELFNKRTLRDETEGIPRTILIQGRAGIGKTTLCKKLVELHQGGFWNDRFDAVLWVPLRQLQAYKARNIEELLYRKYFSQSPIQKRDALLSELMASIRSGKVLFILDGLDEVVGLEYDEVLAIFLKLLLQQEHVVITSRPSGVVTSNLPTLDLEFETVGFSTQNVKHYLFAVVNNDEATAIQTFIQRTPLLQSLANIPVQLDVICYIWGSFPADISSITMTQLYKLLVKKLWCKDIERLQRKENKIVPTLEQTNRFDQRKIKSFVNDENEYLGYLALRGLINNYQIEFDLTTLRLATAEIDSLRKINNLEILPVGLRDDLKQTSFLHSADADVGSNRGEDQYTWHFLHLTFQEYFASTWLASRLQLTDKNDTDKNDTDKNDTDKKSTDKNNTDKNDTDKKSTVKNNTDENGADENDTESLPCPVNKEQTVAFINKHKYDPRYEIVWWMLAGQLSGDALSLFFDILQGAPCDLIGIRHQIVLAGCYRESQSSLSIGIARHLEIEMYQWLVFDKRRREGNYEGGILGKQSVIPEELLVQNLLEVKEYQRYALEALSTRPFLKSTSISILINCLSNANFEHKTSVFYILGNQPSLPESATIEIAQILGTDDKTLEKLAFSTLDKQAKLPESAISKLIKTLSHDNKETRKSAAETLQRQSTFTESAILDLIKTLHNEKIDTDIRELVASILREIPPKSASTSRCGAPAPKRQGSMQTEDIKAIINRFKSQSHGGRSSLQEPVARAPIDHPVTAAPDVPPIITELEIPALISTLEDEENHERHLAAVALVCQSSLSETTITALTDFLLNDKNDKDTEVIKEIKEIKKSVAEALGKQTTLPILAIPKLIKLLLKGRDGVRLATAALNVRVILKNMKHLSGNDIEIFYKYYLFTYSCENLVSLFIHDNHLWYYTEHGRESDRLSLEAKDGANEVDKICEISTAFKNVQIGGGIIGSHALTTSQKLLI